VFNKIVAQCVSLASYVTLFVSHYVVRWCFVLNKKKDEKNPRLFVSVRRLFPA